jgi:hypothetical protein
MVVINAYPILGYPPANIDGITQHVRKTFRLWFVVAFVWPIGDWLSSNILTNDTSVIK